MRGASVIAVILVATLPTVAVAQATGSFSAAGVDIPRGSAADLALVAMYASDLGAGTILRGTAQSAHIERFEFVQHGGAGVQVALENRSAVYTLHDVDLLLSGAPSGFLAIARTGAYVSARWEPARESAVAPASSSVIGNAPTTNGRPSDAGSPGFGVVLDMPHLRADAAGTFLLEGDLALKLRGSTLRLDAAENSTEVETGPRTDPLVPTRSTDRWVYVTVTGARLELTLPKPAQLAAWRCRVELHAGDIVLEDALGNVTEGTRVYQASREDMRLSGDLRALIWPDGDGIEARLRIEIEGDLAAANLRTTGRAWVPRSEASMAGLLVLGVAGVVVASAVMVATKRKRASSSLSVEQLVDLAGEAAEAGRHADALEWTLAAQARSPTSARLITDEGFLRSALDDVEGALSAYDRAAHLDPSGEGEFLAAVLLCERGDLERACGYLLRALDRAPSLAFEVLDDPTFAQLMTRRDVSDALRDALARAREQA